MYKIKKNNKALLITILLILLFTSIANAGWHFVEPMPVGVYGHDAALGVDGKIHVMGGFVWYHHDGRYSNMVYNPDGDYWEVLMPVPGFILRRKIGIFNTELNKWEWKKLNSEIEISDMSITRNTSLDRQGDGVAIVTGIEGKIYWIGGNGRWTPGVGESIVLPFDPVFNKWPEANSQRVYYSETASSETTIFDTSVPEMNDRRIDHEAVITSDGKIYVMGGRQTEMIDGPHGERAGREVFVLDSLECYDPETNTWEYKAPMQLKRMLFAATVGPDDKIYVFGGSVGFTADPGVLTLDTTEVYDPKTDSWSTRTPMPEPKDNHVAVLGADGKIYVLGGSKGGDTPPQRDVFIYDPVKDTWEKGPKMKRPRGALAAVATPEGKIYAIGGTDVGAYKGRQKLNMFLPKDYEVYDGKVQDTVEVLDIFD
ncbi:MAG: hypothetical protein K9L30_07225 [Desulfobacterales bacterium]|nr:hypothetical protein [Desulfobacterales bacterium]